MGEECRNCRFSKTYGETLACRRYPPHGAGSSAEQPEVHPTDWCGEWFRMRPNDALPVPKAPSPKPTLSYGRAKAMIVESGTSRNKLG